ncbi:MAG: hypothetical protein MHPSP_001717, partial [Paramarteilia canceri]
GAIYRSYMGKYATIENNQRQHLKSIRICSSSISESSQRNQSFSQNAYDRSLDLVPTRNASLKDISLNRIEFRKKSNVNSSKTDTTKPLEITRLIVPDSGVGFGSESFSVNNTNRNSSLI